MAPEYLLAVATCFVIFNVIERKWVLFSGGEIRGFLLRICFFMHQLVLRWFFCFACRYGVTFLRVGETPGYKLILFSIKSVFMQWSKIWPTVFYSCGYMLFVLFYPAWMKFRFVQMRVQTLFQCNNKHVLMIFRIPPPPLIWFRELLFMFAVWSMWHFVQSILKVVRILMVCISSCFLQIQGNTNIWTYTVFYLWERFLALDGRYACCSGKLWALKFCFKCKNSLFKISIYNVALLVFHKWILVVIKEVFI